LLSRCRAYKTREILSVLGVLAVGRRGRRVGDFGARPLVSLILKRFITFPAHCLKNLQIKKLRNMPSWCHYCHATLNPKSVTFKDWIA
jgi:hypothetical protein